MSIFNKENRTKNAIKTSLISTTTNFGNMFLAFLYRTIFVYFLSATYLGINGLFTNILQMLSLAELGITSAITFRFYEPISNGDVIKVGKLMNFFKQVYRIIAVIILCIGLSLIPFLYQLIGDASEIPGDINLAFVYILFLLQSVSTYTYSYKQTLLAADQKRYLVSLFNLGINFSKYILQIVALILTKNFTLTLIVSIVTTLILNFIISLYVTKNYSEVFNVKENLSKEEKKHILKDTQATICHKIGYTILTGTDNIILTKYVSLAITGLYSNYSLILINIQKVFSQLLGNFTSSIGNAHIELEKERKHEIFIKMLFINLWLSTVITTCVYLLISDFIELWLGKDMQLSNFTTLCLSVQFFCEVSRVTCTSFIDGCGLFVKDKIRPLIEAILNLIISLILVKLIGVAGVFLGTIISHLATVFWREPYLLYKHEFKKSSKPYWSYFLSFSFITLILCFLGTYVKSLITISHVNLLYWISQGFVIFGLTNLVLSIIFYKNSNFKYFIQLVKSIFKKKIRR